MRKKIFALVFLFLLTLSSHSLADELSGTTWMMFIPNFGKNTNRLTFLVGFTEIQQNGSAIEGVFKTAATDPMHFTNGSIKKTADGYEFKIIVPHGSFKGKMLPISEAGYSPKDSLEQEAVNMLNSNGVKILYKIVDGSMYSKTGFGPITQTTFKNATGIVFFPKQ